MAGTGVGKFSSTAGNNTSNMTVNFAENMAPSNVNNAARELMAHIYDMYKQLGDGYFEFGDGDATYTVARSDADTITITSASDISSIYFPGRKIRITDGGANVVEGTIASSSHTSTTQTVNLTGISLASGTPTKVELGIDTAAFGGRLILDDDGDSYIEAPTDDTIDFYAGGTKIGTFTATTVDFNDGVTITTADNSDTLTLKSTDDDTAEGPVLKFTRDPSGVADGDLLGAIKFVGDDAGGNATDYFELQSSIGDEGAGSEDGRLTFYGMVGGTARNVLDITHSNIVFNQDSQDIDFRVESNGVGHMLFVDGGNDKVGIAYSAPVSTLTVGGQITATAGAVSAPTYSFHSDTNTGMTRPTTDTLTLVTGGSERIRIDSSGKVGIGATTPAQQLSILNDQNTDTAMRISNGTAGTAARSTIFLDVDGGGAQLMAVNASFSTSGPYIADNVTFVSDTAMTNGMTIGTRSSDGNAHLRFYTQDSQKLKINSTGGLINTMPINDVYGIDNQITPSSGNLYAQKNTFENRSPDDNTSSFYWGNDNVTARFGVYSDGDVQNHDNSYGAFSDERIKQDIRDANSQWDDIKAVKVRNFKKKDDVRQYGDKAWEQIGVIAQEIEAAGMDKLIKHSNPSAGDIASSSEFGTLWTADDPETQDAVEEVLYTANDPETQDVLYTADDVETQDGFYTEEDELPEGVEVGDVKPAAKSVGDVKEYATASVGDIKIEAQPSTAQIGEIKEIKAQVKKIGYSVLYMKAIKALQEAMNRIETLETKVNELEG